jgi:anionic cell wall polymer biosynthesis LytR-Cps2A-Psr (LCP) family protein
LKAAKVDASPLLLGLIVLLAAVGAFLTFVILRSDPIEDALSGERVVSTMFIIEQDRKPLGSYVLFYYPATRRAVVFDIPGELGLIIQQINRMDRIDRVYESQKPAAFEREIEKLLGIDINYSIIIGMENLGRLVDLIEGVELFIPAAVEIYDDENSILFPYGVTRLDGDKAKLYFSYDLQEEEREMARFRRQRFFLGFIKSLGEQSEYLKAPRVARYYHPLMKSNLSQRARARLFDELSKVDIDRVNIQSVGGAYREDVSGQTLLFPSYDGSLIKEIVRQSLAALTRQVEGAITERIFTVEILNGTATPGLAGRTAELLRGFGYDIISIGNADHSDYNSTEVIDRSGHEDIVRTFADTIRCKNIRFEALTPEVIELGIEIDIQNLEYRSDFTLILGKDFDGRYVNGR